MYPVFPGDFASAIETLVTAISLIKQSKIASDDRCKILISSLQDTLHGIEEKSYGARYCFLIWLSDLLRLKALSRLCQPKLFYLNFQNTEVTAWVGKLSEETSCHARSLPACS